jgi:hypothetical protein
MAELRQHLLPLARPYTYAELCAAASRHGVDQAIRRREITRVLPGVYASSIHAESWSVRARAAILWGGPRALLAGASALCAWNLSESVPETAHLLLPHGAHRRPPQWLKVATVTYDVPFAWWQGDVPAALPEFAVAQAYGRAKPHERAEIVYRAFRSGAVTAESMASALQRMPRVRARASLAARVAYAADGVESFLEERGLRQVFTGAPFRHLLRQHRVVVDHRRFRLDLFDPLTLTCFELDGEATHGTVVGRQGDVARDALLAGVGILTVRFTYRDVVERPGWCRDLALEVMAQRGAVVGGGASVGARVPRSARE